MQVRFCFIILFFITQLFFIDKLYSNSNQEVKNKKLNFTTKITLGGNYQTGNTEKSGLSLSALVSAKDSIKEFSLNGRYNYGKDRNVKNVQDYLVGVQYDYHPFATFSPFLRFELYSNEFQKIKQRYSGLLGGKYRIYSSYEENKLTSEYSVSAAVLIDYEKYIKEADLSDKEKYRLSLRPKMRQEIMKNILLNLELFYQPAISDFHNYLIDGKVSLDFRVNQYIFLKSSYEYKYNSKPATSDVKKQDTLFLMSLGVEF